MARRLSNGKWNPVVYRNGYVEMVELREGEPTYTEHDWKLVECDTKEEAEAKEKEYYDFWKDRN